MKIKNKNRINMLLLLFCCLFFSSFGARAEMVDKIAAVVDDDVILELELQREMIAVMQRMKSTGTTSMPPEYLLRKQVLEKMIIDKLQRQIATKAGITVNDEMLQASAADIAQKNGLSPEQFKEELERSGIPYNKFLEDMRNEIIINQLRAREIGGRVKVTDREVEHYLETQEKTGDAAMQYHIGHILIALKEGATADDIQQAQSKADNLVKSLRAGQDFQEAAASNSDDDNALKGGDLGWRTVNDIPSQLVEGIRKMKVNEVSDAIHSPSGFHVIKMLGIRNSLDNHIVTTTDVRHILIKPNELIDDAEAEKRLLALKERVQSGDDFAALARSHSDDKGSALKGGSLGWVEPGNLVPQFEQAMEKLKINEVSNPLQTQFGWHLIQVLGRKNKDNSSEYKKNLVREAIRKRKIEEETELWLRRLRDEAFIEIHEN
jgi:peptidyl-prolyl cis-trans isomerase SurA